MKIKKIIAAIAAAAVTVSMVAVNAFAATVTLDSEYPGGWAASKTIPKSEFEAIGGDVKVVLTVETKEPLIGSHNHLAKPMNICVSWDAITDSLTSDTAIAKMDGFFVFAEGQTTLEFVVPESAWSEFKGYDDEDADGNAGLAFQVNDVIIKSAELSAGSAQGAIKRVDEAQSAEIMDGKSYEEVTGDTSSADAATDDTATDDTAADDSANDTDADTSADTSVDTASTPVADSTTTSTSTGNVPAVVMVSVMAVAGVAAVASKKRK